MGKGSREVAAVRGLQLRYRDINELVPYVRNARTHSDDQIAQVMGSIREFGFTNPVLIDEHGSIIAGHGRVMAARRLEMAEVPTIELAGLTQAQKRAYALADNKIALNAGWDPQMLAFELQDLMDSGYDLPLTGFSEEEAAQFIKDADPASGGGGDDEAVDDSPVAGDRFAVFSAEQVADQAAKELHRTTFADYAPTKLAAMVEINRGAAGKRIIHTIADRWYPHRHSTIAGQKGRPTPNERLQDAAWIKRTTLYVCSDQIGQCGARGEILAMLRRYFTQGAGQFPPGTARDLYRKYAPPGGRVLDPCAGWGGRIIGWLASCVGGTYHGFDACPVTVASAAAMIADLGIGGAQVLHGAFEDQRLEPDSFDFAFTSPPYFDVELYGDDPAQSVIRYPTYPAWRDGFLAPFVRCALHAIKPGAHFVVNTSDTVKHPIATDLLAIAGAQGASTVERSEVVHGTDSGGLSHRAREDLIVMRKS